MQAAAIIAALTLTLGAARAASPWKVATGFTTDWEHLAIEVQRLGPNVYYLHGSGGNIALLTGPEGALLVDDEFAQVAPKLKAKLKELGAGPVRYVFSTHFHSDHTGANGSFIRDGACVVAQENCRAQLLVSHYNAHWHTHTPPIPEAEAPTLTFRSHLELHFDGETIVATHLRPAHTDGDAIIYFRKANLVHLGDVYINGLYPYIDVSSKGTIDGYFPVIDEVLAAINDQTRVIPGHGPVATKAELKAYRDMLQVVRDRVAAGIAAGKTLEQIIESNPSKEYDPAWASDRVGPESLTAMIYQSLTGKRLDWMPPPGSL